MIVECAPAERPGGSSRPRLRSAYQGMSNPLAETEKSGILMDGFKKG